MKINKAEFITSVADKNKFLSVDKPVIAICGRSNVGKSSFINMLANRKKLARTSRDPGRTRLVNYFDFDKFVIADLPGYGFAQVSKSEKLKWANTIEAFFRSKNNIDHAFVLIDIRREPTNDDIDFINYLNHYIIPFTVICTKADKLSKTRIKPAKNLIAQSLTLGEKNVLAVSNENAYGKEDVLNRLDEVLHSYDLQKQAENQNLSSEQNDVDDENNSTDASES